MTVSLHAIIVHDQSVINFSPTAEVDTHVCYFCSFDNMVCRLLCVKSSISKFFGGLFTILIANIFHLYSVSLETFYSIEIFSSSS